MCWFTVVASSSRRVLQSLLDNMIIVVAPVVVVLLLLISAHSAITITRPSLTPQLIRQVGWFTVGAAPDRFLNPFLMK